ncbi:MAG: hypothetical protein HFACDABA_00805 [Anaerolineales bacterium]|nr:hypothetical protein [Anaerolineales bacterium]
MKRNFPIVLASLMLALAMLACSTGGAPAVSDQDAINTAVAGTQQSQALAQATVNSAVLTAMPATPTPGPTVEYVNLTEEELAALIDEAVSEAVAATEATTTAVTSATYDDSVTTEEVAYVYEYYYYADYYVEYAEELMYEYYQLYSELATQMIVEMNAIESELSQMNDTLGSIDQSLQEISATLAQGLELAQSAIDQLENAAQTAQTKAQDVKNQAQDMINVLHSDQQGRVDQIAQVAPNNIPTDKLSALQSGFDFIDAARNALGDNKLSREELMNLAQLGANAQAGFANFGRADGPGALDFSQFSGKFNEIMGQFARGQMPQGRANLDGFERSLGSRPSGFGGGPGNGGPGGGGPGGGGGAPGPRP